MNQCTFRPSVWYLLCILPLLSACNLQPKPPPKATPAKHEAKEAVKQEAKASDFVAAKCGKDSDCDALFDSCAPELVAFHKTQKELVLSRWRQNNPAKDSATCIQSFQHMHVYCQPGADARCKAQPMVDINPVRILELDLTGEGKPHHLQIRGSTVEVFEAKPITENAKPKWTVAFKPYCGSLQFTSIEAGRWSGDWEADSCGDSGSARCVESDKRMAAAQPLIESGMQGFSIRSGECDAHHVYYDPLKKILVRWSF